MENVKKVFQNFETAEKGQTVRQLDLDFRVQRHNVILCFNCSGSGEL